MASPIITPMPVQTDTNYRPISRMAVIGLILALTSTLIFASETLSWMLLVVVLPAVILCILAWRSIRNSQGNLAGEALAVLGIVMSVGSGLGWLTMTAVSKYVTESEARAACDDWLAKLQKGEAGAAFLMLVPPGNRRLDFNPEEYSRLRQQFPGQQQNVSEFDNFLVEEVTGQLLRYGDKVQLKYGGLVESKSIREAAVFRFRYFFNSPSAQGMFVVVARAQDYYDEDGIRRDWVLSIDSNATQTQDYPYGEQLRITGARASDAVERFIFAVANPEDKDLIQKMVDPKNQGELQTVMGYIRPKGKVGHITTIETQKPMRLRADSKTNNSFTVTYDCTTIIEKDRAVDFSITYVTDINNPEKSMLQDCRFIGTRRIMKAAPGVMKAGPEGRLTQ